MSEELKKQWSSDDTVYAIIRDDAGLPWDTNAVDYDDPWDDSNYANYDISMTDAGGNMHIGDFPADADTGFHWIQYYIQEGDAPAVTDETIGELERVYWNTSTNVLKTEAEIALSAYDAPTKAEMDAAHALLATVAKQDISDAKIVLILSNTGIVLPARFTNIDTELDGIGNELTTTRGIVSGIVEEIDTFEGIDFNYETDSLKSIRDRCNDILDDTNAIDGKIGTIPALDSAAQTIGAAIGKLADDNAGANFIAARDSLNKIRTRGDLAWLTGAGSIASKVYTITSLVRTIGDNDGGDDGDVDVVDGSYFSTGETNAGTRLEVDATFTAGDVTENPIALLMWGFYAGGGNHHINVFAYNYISSNFEVVGEIANSDVVTFYQFTLNPEHIDLSTGLISIKFAHDPPTFGVTNHVFNIDKIIVTTAISLSTAMKAVIGITEGGTWTWPKVMKIMTAFAAGNWRVKESDSTKQELLDAEDGTTVILEQTITRSPSAGNKYRDITVKI